MEKLTWISLKSEWPEETENVLWCIIPVEEPYWFGCIVDDAWRDSFTHWMRIPEPTSSGSVAAPKEDGSIICGVCKSRTALHSTNSEFLCYVCFAKRRDAELASLRQQLKEREESIKDLIPIAEKTHNDLARHQIIYVPLGDGTVTKRNKLEIWGILDRAKALLDKK